MPKQFYKKNTFWRGLTGCVAIIGCLLIAAVLVLLFLSMIPTIDLKVDNTFFSGMGIAGGVLLVVGGCAYFYAEGYRYDRHKKRLNNIGETKAQFTALSDSSASDASVEDEFSRS